jgi:outer membrane protein OmpA-like peptidoglycan-associated protein
MQLVGNTCNLGESNAYINVALGLKRAESTRRYMISKGINAGRLSISSHASYDPMRPNTSEANRAYNRRCDFTVFTGSVSDHF